MKNKTKKFLVYIKQSGEGCDYMIACGKKSFFIEAKDITQAHERFVIMLSPNFDDDVEWTDDDGGYFDEQSLSSAQIFEVVDEVRVDLKAAYCNIEELALIESRLEIEKREREEYEKLKQKYE
tara:strand:+ start:2688 stop:3056 length:369 start_codon:yes stop_codon:yes gene_type:complete